MIPLRDAQAEILGAVGVLSPVRRPVAGALGLVLADEIVATESVPPFANSAMDGYAVRAADTAGATAASPVRLRVVGELPAGRAPDRVVGPGEAIRIMTGAVFPDGADSVVMVERTRRDGDAVLVAAAAAPGDHRREPGGDVRAGDAVFPAGIVLGPAHVGVLTSLGLSEVSVHPPARVGVFSTGDELVESGALGPGQIRDSNRPMLVALARQAGCEVVDLGLVPDDEARITALLEQAFATCDAVITTGGVSMGEYDYVKSALDRMGVLRWWQVAIKPAKPLAFGVVDAVPVFGLPGNPVSAHVSFECFARPALLHLMGHRERFRPEVVATVERAMPRRPDGKLHLDRVFVRYDGERYLAVRAGLQASNALSAMALANGLALLPDGDGAAEGDPVRVMLLDAAPDH